MSKNTKGPKTKGTSIIRRLAPSMSGGGERRDKKLREAEMKALGIKPKKKGK